MFLYSFIFYAGTDVEVKFVIRNDNPTEEDKENGTAVQNGVGQNGVGQSGVGQNGTAANGEGWPTDPSKGIVLKRLSTLTEIDGFKLKGTQISFFVTKFLLVQKSSGGHGSENFYPVKSDLINRFLVNFFNPGRCQIFFAQP